MFVLCLLTVLGLALADTSPLCGGDCPADWKKVEGDCVMFLYGWEELSARQVCRGLEAEYSEFFLSRSDSDNATRHSLPVCLLSRETPSQGRQEIWSGLNIIDNFVRTATPAHTSCSRGPHWVCGGRYRSDLLIISVS